MAGDVLPRSPSQISPHSFESRVRAAAQAGYTGLGLMNDDLAATTRRMGLSAMRRCLDDHGLRHLELEFLGDWFADSERRAASDRTRAELLAAAQALGARHIKIGGDRYGAHWPLAQLVDSFARLCEEAARHGTAIVLELLPWTQLATPAQALPLLEQAQASNAGLLLDVWHLQRAGVPWSSLAALPPRWVRAAELSDAGPPEGDVWADTIHRRRLCGEGGFDLRGFIQALQATGFDGPWGIEIISDTHRTLPLSAAAQRAIDTARQQFVQNASSQLRENAIR
nr:sugar phosphate isomerase/epimerase [Variovorax terrae]